MARFPLLNLDPVDLEKVITKVEGRSYCRLQRTCRTLKEFISSSHRISVPLDGRYTIGLVQNPAKIRRNDHTPEFYGSVDSESGNVLGKLETVGGFYGTRLNLLSVPRIPWEEEIPFEPFCEMLKKNRITCNILAISQPMTKEQISILFGLLKPVHVGIDCRKHIDSFEAVFQSKILKKVQMWLDSDAAICALSRHLTSFEEVELTVTPDPTEKFTLLQAVLQIFLSNYCHSLLHFEFNVRWRLRTFPTEDDMKKLFPGIKLILRWSIFWKVVYEVQDLPPYFPQETLCLLTVDSDVSGGKILYMRNPGAVDYETV